MSQTAKSASSQGTDAKDKGAPAPAATSKATKTGEPGMGSYKVSVAQRVSFQMGGHVGDQDVGSGAS